MLEVDSVLPTGRGASSDAGVRLAAAAVSTLGVATPPPRAQPAWRSTPDAIERLVRVHARTAAATDTTFPADTVHPHVLRHTCAMNLLQAGIDTAVIALWLGHADIRSTTTYLHADMTIKERVLERMTPAAGTSSRFKPSDNLLAFLDAL